tara:strand:- start:75 stop:419 length:345 start_codon:yes stop_codon:yes gene_type:complete
MNHIEDDIIQRFQAEDGVWIVESGKAVEAGLLKQAIARIEDLKFDLEDAEALTADWEDHFDVMLEEALDDYEEQRDKFAKAYSKTLSHVLQMKVASEAMTAACNTFLIEDKDEQ